MRLSRRLLPLAPLVACSLAPACSSEGRSVTGIPDGYTGVARQAYADAVGTDVVADAPWRVQSADTLIPFNFIIADARTGYEPVTLGEVTLYALTQQGDRVVYRRDFQGLDLSASEYTKYLWNLHVTRFRGSSFVDGQPITASALLGAGAAGKTLEFRAELQVQVFGRSALNQVRLRVHVGEAALPHGHGLFAGWLAGDTHVHSMYTHNWAEFGVPHRAMAGAARAIGLDWVFTTDHSCDLDPTYSTPAGDLSRRVDKWTFCEGDQAPDQCTQRDNSGLPDGWEMADNDSKDAETWAAGQVMLHTGEEVTVKSHDGKTMHMLALNAGYVLAMGSGGDMYGIKDPVTVTMVDAVKKMPATGMAFAAHPTQPLPSAINGTGWTDQDVLDAAALTGFMGFELWNMGKRHKGAGANPFDPGGLNPFGGWNPCEASDPECSPAFLDTAMPWWDRWLSHFLASGGPHMTLIGGSDAHGDFNYQTLSSNGLSLDTTNDSAFGKPRTVVLTKNRDMAEVLQAVRQGRAVVTDGPMMTLGIDATGDGSIDQFEDVHVGATHYQEEGKPLTLRFKWQSSAEFGELTGLVLYRGTATTAAAPESYDLLGDPDSLGDCAGKPLGAGTCSITLGSSTKLAPPPSGAGYYYRAMASSGAEDYHAVTNPIWVVGGVAPDGGAGGSAGAAGQSGAGGQAGQAGMGGGAGSGSGGTADSGAGGTNNGGAPGSGGSSGKGGASGKGGSAGSAGSAGAAAEASDDGGCGCRQAQGGDAAGLGTLSAVGLLGLLSRRRKRN